MSYIHILIHSCRTFFIFTLHITCLRYMSVYIWPFYYIYTAFYLSLIHAILLSWIKTDGSFANAVKCLSKRAMKSLGRLKRLFFNTNIYLSIPILVKLFHCLISSILLYTCEVWGPYLLSANKYMSMMDILVVNYLKSFEKVYLSLFTILFRGA